MNKLMRVVMLGVFVLGLGYSTVVRAADDVAAVKADHLADAAAIEKQVAEQDALIAFHTKMKENAPVKYFAREKTQWGPTATSKVREMNMHCDGIIDSAKKLKAELTGLAAWHKEQASL